MEPPKPPVLNHDSFSQVAKKMYQGQQKLKVTHLIHQFYVEYPELMHLSLGNEGQEESESQKITDAKARLKRFLVNLTQLDDFDDIFLNYVEIVP